MTQSNQPLALSVATFAAELSSQEKQDVSDLLLQADIFASITWNRQVYWKSWADYHRNRMLKHGCKEHGVIATEPQFLTRQAELEKPIRLRIVGGGGSPRMPQMAIEALNAAGFLKFAREFLRSGSEISQLGSFQVVPCIRDTTGEVQVFVCGLHVAGKVDDRNRELVLRFNGGSYTFSTERFSQHRAQVRKDLERYAMQRIRHLEL
ncbi:hypothetical protein [Pseudomonas sp. dw_358]|uniref:hypothetical protein n=1 Tax=Pseudomonas sp. dw_358 TaxID=2720083 RepID=UPI001BD5441D|nr:hypothetical protein [Pseudomonas sp. dw_358]